MSRPATNTPGQEGFTLLELLIALTLSGLILTSLTLGLRIISGSWERGAELAERHEAIGMAQDFLRREVSHLQWIEWSGSEQRRLAFEGSARRLRYIVAEPPYPDRPGLFAIELALERRTGRTERLVRRRARYHPEAKTFRDLSFGDEVVLLEGELGLQFAYRDFGATEAWRTAWDEDDRLPSLIALRRRASASGDAPWPDLWLRPGAQMAGGCLADETAEGACRGPEVESEEATNPARQIFEDGPAGRGQESER